MILFCCALIKLFTSVDAAKNWNTSLNPISKYLEAIDDINITYLDTLVYFLPKTFKLFGSPICWLEAYQVKVIPETRRAH